MSRRKVASDSASKGKTHKVRKTYRKPQLMELGDLRSMTLGGSPGTGDSGSSGTRKPASGLPQPGGFPPLPPEGFTNPSEPPKP